MCFDDSHYKNPVILALRASFRLPLPCLGGPLEGSRQHSSRLLIPFMLFISRLQVDSNDLFTTSPPPSSAHLLTPDAPEAAPQEDIPDIEDALGGPPDNDLLPDLEDYCTTGPGSWVATVHPTPAFPGFRLPSRLGTDLQSAVQTSGISADASVQLSLGKIKANSGSAGAKTQSSAELGGLEGWEFVELAGKAGTAHKLAKPQQISSHAPAALHAEHGQSSHGGGRQASSRSEASSIAMQASDGGLETSMAAWLPQRDLLCAAGLSSGVSSGVGLAPASTISQLLDESLTTAAHQQGTAAALQQCNDSEPGWVDLSLTDNLPETPSSSNADTSASQHSGSTISEALPPMSHGSDDSTTSPKIMARLGSSQKAHWTAFSNLSAQVSAKGLQLSSQLSDKGKQLMEQAQASVAAAVAEARQVPAGTVVQRGSEAVQQVTQQLQPQASAGASAVVKDVQQLTAGVKEATADLTGLARSWWQRCSTS